MLSDLKRTDSFTEFFSDAEPKLRRALTAALGVEVGRESSAEALAYGWEHWDRLRLIDNPAGYLYLVGRGRGRRMRRSRPASVAPVTAGPTGLIPLAESLAEQGAIVATTTYRAASNHHVVSDFSRSRKRLLQRVCRPPDSRLAQPPKSVGR